MVEYSPHYPKVGGSNTATDAGRKRIVHASGMEMHLKALCEYLPRGPILQHFLRP